MSNLLNPFRLGHQTNPDAAAIVAGLVAWWTFDENAANTTYADSVASNNLTCTDNTSSVTTTSAQKTRAYNNNNQDNHTAKIPRSNTNLDATDADFSFGGWFRTNQVAATAAFIMGRVGGTTNKIDAYMYYENDATIRFAISHTDGSVANRIIANSAEAGDDSAFELIVGTYDKTNGNVIIRKQGVADGSPTKVSTSLAGHTIFTGSNNSNFCISEGVDSDTNFSAAVNRSGVHVADECFYFRGVFTDAMYAYLFNNGTGKSYAELTADAA